MAAGAATDRYVPRVGRVEVDRAPARCWEPLRASLCGAKPQTRYISVRTLADRMGYRRRPTLDPGAGGPASRPVFCASGSRRGSSTETTSGGLEPLNGLALTRRSPWWRTRRRN